MKTAKYSFAALIVILAAAYFGAWTYSAFWFRDEIDRLYDSAEKDGITYLGPKPVLSNFPFVPEAHYTGGIRTGNVEFLFPEMVLRGYPIPHLNLTAMFPQGVSLSAKLPGGFIDPALWSLDTLSVTVKIPERLPQAFLEEDLRDWQQDGGKITVEDIALTKGALNAQGRGFLLLDEALQPELLLDAVMKGHEDFIASMRDNGTIAPLPAAIATTILNGLGQQDEKTGERIVPINISAKNQMLTVGPVQAIPLPEMVWDKRSSPAPRL